MPQFDQTLICPACRSQKALTRWLCEACDPPNLLVPDDYPVDPTNADNSQTFSPCHHCHTLYSDSVVECPRCGETGHVEPYACQSCISQAETRRAIATYGHSCNAVTLTRASLEPHPLRCDICDTRIRDTTTAAIFCPACYAVTEHP